MGWEPTALVGGHVPQWDERNYLRGGGPWLVCEADESDGSFVQLSPQAVLLTNVEADHLDFHGTLDNLHGAFRAFLARVGAGGALVFCAEDAVARQLASAHPGPRLAYGYADGAGGDATVRVDGQEPGGTRMTIAFAGRQHTLVSPLLGRHNALNLAGVFALGCVLGAAPARLLAGLADFRGVARRQQWVGRLPLAGGDLTIYDDYAHHPTEVAATLECFRAIGRDPLTVVFQPHLYSRTLQHAEAFAAALRPADRVYVTDVYRAREAPRSDVSGSLIVGHLRGHSAAHFLPDWRAFPERVRAGEVPPGLVLTLGAGDITGLGALLLQELG
jgi:UDP-N-acetylmuramate--alanine ligase